MEAVREKKERQREKGSLVKAEIANKGERKTVTMTTSVLHQSIALRSRLLAHNSLTMTDNIDEAQGSIIQTVVTIVREIDAGSLDLVHVALRREGRLATIVVVVAADALGQDQRLI